MRHLMAASASVSTMRSINFVRGLLPVSHQPRSPPLSMGADRGIDCSSLAKNLNLPVICDHRRYDPRMAHSGECGQFQKCFNFWWTSKMQSDVRLLKWIALKWHPIPIQSWFNMDDMCYFVLTKPGSKADVPLAPVNSSLAKVTKLDPITSNHNIIS